MNDPHTQTDRPDPIDERLFAYHDGELDESSARAFEHELESDPALRAKLDALRALDGSLRDLATPAPRPLPISDAPRIRGPRRFGAIAAGIAIIAGAGFTTHTLSRPASPSLRAPRARFENGFDAQRQFTELAAHLTPQTVCDTPEKFLDYTINAFNEPIGADFGAPGIELVGWRMRTGDYESPDPDTPPAERVLMARTADGDPILVYFVPQGCPEPMLPESSTLVLHRSRIGSVHLVEVSERTEVAVLPHLFDAR